MRGDIGNRKKREETSDMTNSAANRPDVGASPGPNGATFRVWAPHAETVYVTGTFNDWNKTATPLSKEENGYWSAAVSKAKTGDEYRYLIHGPTGLSHISTLMPGR